MKTFRSVAEATSRRKILFALEGAAALATTDVLSKRLQEARMEYGLDGGRVLFRSLFAASYCPVVCPERARFDSGRVSGNLAASFRRQ